MSVLLGIVAGYLACVVLYARFPRTRLWSGARRIRPGEALGPRGWALVLSFGCPPVALLVAAIAAIWVDPDKQGAKGEDVQATPYRERGKLTEVA